MKHADILESKAALAYQSLLNRLAIQRLIDRAKADWMFDLLSVEGRMRLMREWSSRKQPCRRGRVLRLGS